MKPRLLVLILCLPLAAAEKDLGEQFRDALYIEEVERNPAKAAESYQALLEAFDQQRSLAASTIFRLAEVRKGQDRKEEAVTLYQRLLREFPEFERENKLSRERLASLGAKAEAPAKLGEPKEDADLLQLEDYQRLATTKPDKLLFGKELNDCVKEGYLRSVTYLIDEQGNEGDESTLAMAVGTGSLPMTRLLLEKLELSPDASGLALAKAIRENFPNVLQLLLEGGIDPDSPYVSNNNPSSALLVAVENGNAEAAKVLLEKGADPNRLLGQEGDSQSADMMLVQGSALHAAAWKNRLQLVDLLLAKGAKANLAAAGGGYTPLHSAVLSQPENGEPMIIQRLLAAGADPNSVASSSTSRPFNPDPFSSRTRRIDLPVGLPAKATPLDLAFHKPCLPAVKALIKGGGEFNAESLKNGMRDVIRRSDGETRNELVKTLLQLGVEPSSEDLEVAVGAGDGKLMELLLSKGLPDGYERAFEIALAERSGTPARALLEAGVDPNALIETAIYFKENTARRRAYPPLSLVLDAKRKDLFDLLIEKGADPNIRVGWSGSGSLPKGERSVMYWDLFLRGSPDRECFQWLLDAGFEPGDELLLLIDEVAKIDTDGSMVAELIKRKPEGFDAAKVPDMDGWEDGARKVYLEKMLYPAAQDPESIQMIHLGAGTLDLLEKKGSDQEPPSLARLLLDQHKLGKILSNDFSSMHHEIGVVRKSPSGDWQGETIKLDEGKRLPSLQWGDLVVLPPIEKNTTVLVPKADFLAVMRRNLEFPLTLTMDGKTREVTMSGHCLFYNPVSDVVPLWNASELAKQVWQPTNPWDKSALGSPILEVERKGWGRIPLTDSSGASQFEFQAGDHVFVTTPQNENDAKGYSQEKIQQFREYRRQQAVIVVIPGTPVVRTFADYSRKSGSKVPVNPVTIPTLTQAIAATFAPELEFDEGDPHLVAREILVGGIDAPVLPPRPDFSTIVIRRLKPDGSEERIEVDLFKKMESVTPKTTPEEARKLDIALQTGDVVELHLPEGATEPWDGFSETEKVFMDKIHTGVITALPQGGAPMRVSLNWEPATWIELDGQKLPLKPKTGDSSAIANDVSSLPWKRRHDDVSVRRDGTEHGKASLYTLFLRDGDSISGKPETPMRPIFRPGPVPSPR